MFASEYPIITDEGYLPFVVCGAGRSDCQSHIIRENGFCVHQLMFTTSGCGRLRYMGGEVLLPEGSCIILQKDLPHEYMSADGNPWGVGWVIFVGSHVEELMHNMELDVPTPASLKSLSAMDELYKKLFRTLRTKERLCIHKASPILHRMINELYASYKNYPDQDSHTDMSDMLRASLAFIEENYSEQLTLEQLAEKSGVGREYYCSIFKKCMGMRPFEYIAMKRVQEAKKLLSSTEMSVSEIGRTVGYSDKSYFGHVFRKYAGMSPSAFRGF